MSRRSLFRLVRLALCVGFCASATLTAGLPQARAEAPAEVRSLLRNLSAETEAARTSALARLEAVEDLKADDLRAALASADPRSRPLLLELVGSRGLESLVPELVKASGHADLRTSEAALRALVRVGDDAVKQALDVLRKRTAASANTSKAAAAGASVASLRAERLLALHRQRSVERDLLGKWRRKAGSYKGRYSELAKHGWYLQAVLTAMLLDIPLEDRFVVVAEEEKDAGRQLLARRLAVNRMALSPRRGYRTFEKLPPHIQSDDLFDLAQQALRDVGDMDLIGDLLEIVAIQLKRAHQRAGFQLRPFEKRMAEDIGTVLYARGRPQLLDEDERQLRARIRQIMQFMNQRGRRREDFLGVFVREAGDLASTLHLMEKYDEAAKWYVEVNKANVELGGEPSAVASYNRACALALGGRKDEAFKQLDEALGLDTSDLTREWVAEDGDLRALHDDPRFEKLLKKHFDSR